MARQRRLARYVALHAVVVGIAWFPVVLGLGIVAGTNPGFGDLLRDTARNVPDWLLHGLVLLGAGFALPLSWPILLALGWIEGGLAQRIAGGDQQAVHRAGRLFQLEGIALLVLTSGVLLVVMTWPDQLSIAVVPGLVAAAHIIAGHRLSAPGLRPAPVFPEPTGSGQGSSGW